MEWLEDETLPGLDQVQEIKRKQRAEGRMDKGKDLQEELVARVENY